MWSNDQQAAIDAILQTGWIQRVDWSAEIDSTNAAARRSLEKLSREQLPMLWVADRQTAGRGRSQRAWWSPSGCLMFTLAIAGDSLPRDSANWSQLALVCGLAVANTVERFVDPRLVQLKWPNDVYLRDKKLAGILIESATHRAAPANAVGPTAPQHNPEDRIAAEPIATQAEKLERPGSALNWLIGIGVNVSMDWRHAPPEVASKATCLSSVAGRPIDAKGVLVELAQELEACIVGWAQQTLAWQTGWRERCLLTGRVLHMRLAGNQELVGVCEGIDASGRLIVRDESQVHILSAGEVLAWQ